MSNYVYNSSLPFIKAHINGNRIRDERFTNYPYPDPEPTLKKVLKWRMSPNPQKQQKQNDTFKLAPEFLPELPTAPDRYLMWLGHASFLLQLGELRILIDPVLGSLPLIRRESPLPIAVEELKQIDYILISHAHRDHFDAGSLNKIIKQNPGAEVLGPLRLSGLLKKLKQEPKYQEAAWYQQFESKKESKIIFLPAVHWHRRGLLDFNKILWGSFYISDGDKTIFFAGDTAYNKHFKTIAEALGKPDICLMPIGAYKPEFLMKASHMSPTEAVKAFNQMEGSLMIPMHYGTFDLSDEPLGEPLTILRELEQQNAASGKIKHLQPGEIFDF